MNRIQLFFILMAATLNIHAAYWTDNGNYDIDWYKSTQNEFTITTAKQLAGVAYLVNNGYTTFSGKTVKLGADINLDGKDWLPIGTDKNLCFQGTIDGCGFTITWLRLKINNCHNLKYYGMFGYLLKAKINNLALDYSYINMLNPGDYNGEIFIGHIAGYIYDGEINNCYVDGSISYERKEDINYTTYSTIHVGGIVGMMYSSHIDYSVNRGNISLLLKDPDGDAYYSRLSIHVGGICGDAEESMTHPSNRIFYCGNQSQNLSIEIGSTKSTPNIKMGGIIGVMSRPTCILGCWNNADYLQIHDTGNRPLDATIGGIAGYCPIGEYSDGYIYDCYSSTADYRIGVWMNSNAIFECGGIVGDYNNDGKSKFKANFSAKNIVYDYYSVSGSSCKITQGYNGDSSYTWDEMRKKSFLKSLNAYTNINNTRPWILPSEGSSYPEIYNQDVTISLPSKLELLEGKETVIDAQVSGPNRLLKYANVIWNTDNSSVVKINSVSDRGSKCSLTGLKEGTTTIRVTVGCYYEAQCDVTVKPNYKEPVAGDEFEYNGIMYSILNADKRTCETRPQGAIPEASQKNMTKVSIPEIVFYQSEAYTVTRIGEYSFGSSNIKSVTFPSTLKEIGMSAFSVCKELESVNVPHSVDKIEMAAFSDCQNLHIVELSNQLTRIEDFCFILCKSLRSIEIPTNVTQIGEGAFELSGLESISLPDNVEHVGKDAFSCCENLSSVKLSSKIKSIGYSSFYSSPLQTIYFSPEVPLCEILANSDMVSPEVYDTATLYVPFAVIDQFRELSPWNLFVNIKPIEGDLPIVNSIREATAMENNTEMLINFPMTVTYINGFNCYAKDEEGCGILIYGSNPYLEFDIIPSGWRASFYLYYGNPEFKPLDNLPQATGSGYFSPEIIRLSEIDSSMVNEVIVIKDVEFNEPTPQRHASEAAQLFYGTEVNGRDRVPFYTNFIIDSVPAGIYDVKGVVAIYKNQVQIYPITYTESSGADLILEDSVSNDVKYFDVTGKRLEGKPNKGIYIKVVNNRFSKHISNN